MNHVLSQRLRHAYDKRDVDSRLRVLYEKEVTLQTTSPPSYLITSVYPIDDHRGTGFKVGDQLEFTGNGNTVKVRVTSITTSGAIASLSWDEDHVYASNPETINPGTLEADENDTFDTPNLGANAYYVLRPTPTNGTPCWVRVITRYAPGDYPRYGDLGHATVHDPLVQASYLTGYVDKALDRAIVLTFRGYVSQYDPRWPWSATKTDGSDQPTNPNRPAGSLSGTSPDVGDLWYQSTVTPALPPTDGTGSIAPESILASLPATPWQVRRWDGFAWLPAVLSSSVTYTPKRLDAWEFLNVTDSSNEGANGQNTGFYWLDQWKLYTFSVDETKFVHRKGNESIYDQKTFMTHPIVPATSNYEVIDKSGIDEQTHYVTKALLSENALLLSGSNRGSDQTVAGTTKFTGVHVLENTTTIGPSSGNVSFTINSTVTTTVNGPITLNGKFDFSNSGVFQDSVEFKKDVKFTSTTADVTFSKDITTVSKSAAALQNVTTHPASEHQVYLASQALLEALEEHKLAAVLDHPDSSVTTIKIKNDAVVTAKIKNEAVTTDKIDDYAVTADKIANENVTNTKLGSDSVTNEKIENKTISYGKLNDFTVPSSIGVRADFSSSTNTTRTFTNFMSKSLSGFVWLESKLHSTTGHKHTGTTSTSSTYDGPQIETGGIKDGAVDSSKLASNAVIMGKIFPGTIVNADISSTAAIATTKLANISSTHEGKFLKKDGTWEVPPDTRYNHVTYTATTDASTGFYKIHVDGEGHVSATTAVTSADIMDLHYTTDGNKHVPTTENNTVGYFLQITAAGTIGWAATPPDELKLPLLGGTMKGMITGKTFDNNWSETFSSKTAFYVPRNSSSTTLAHGIISWEVGNGSKYSIGVANAHSSGKTSFVYNSSGTSVSEFMWFENGHAYCETPPI